MPMSKVLKGSTLALCSSAAWIGIDFCMERFDKNDNDPYLKEL